MRRREAREQCDQIVLQRGPPGRHGLLRQPLAAVMLKILPNEFHQFRVTLTKREGGIAGSVDATDAALVLQLPWAHRSKRPRHVERLHGMDEVGIAKIRLQLHRALRTDPTAQDVTAEVMLPFDS